MGKKKKMGIVIGLMVAVLSLGLFLGASNRTLERLFYGGFLRGVNPVDWTNFEIDELNPGNIGVNRPSGRSAPAGSFTHVTIVDHVDGQNKNNNSNVFQGIMRITSEWTGTLTNGADTGSLETTANYMNGNDQEWTDANGRGNIVVASNTNYYKVGSKSIKVTFLEDALGSNTMFGSSGHGMGDGIQYTEGASWDWSGDEQIGFWIYSETRDINYGSLLLVFEDDNVPGDYGTSVQEIGSVTEDIWTWVHVALPDDNGSKNAVSELRIVQKDDLGSMVVYFDGMYKWDDANEYSLAKRIIPGGMLDVNLFGSSSIGANAPGSSTSGVFLRKATLYTDYFIHYGSTESDSDLVPISNLVGSQAQLLYNYEKLSN